jgi:hypothetical protein
MKLKLILPAVLFIPLISFSQSDFPERTKLALKSGDSQKLSRFCAEKVEFGREGDAESMAALKAGDQLSLFFRENPPADASIHFQGKSKDGRKYMICRYKSKNGQNFRFSFYWKEKMPEMLESIDISKE